MILLEPSIERAPWHAQHLGRAHTVPVAGGQGLGNARFLVLEVRRQGLALGRRGGGRRGLLDGVDLRLFRRRQGAKPLAAGRGGQIQILQVDLGLVAEHPGVEQHVLELPHVAGPVVTGEAPQVADVKEAKSHCHLPVLLGSGISESNIEQFYNEADGFIIGTAFKVEGIWSNTIDPARVTRFLKTVAQLKVSA